MGRYSANHCHGLLSRRRQLDVDIAYPRDPDPVFLFPKVGAALVNVDNLEVPVVVVDNGGDELLPVPQELFLVFGTVDRIRRLSVLYVVLLVVVSKGHS